MQSIKQLANSCDSTANDYQKDTQHDSRALFQFIRKKFGVWDEEVVIEGDFDRFYYESDTSASVAQESPSSMLNTLYTQVYAFVARQFTQIIEDYNSIQVPVTDDDLDDELLGDKLEY